MDELANRAGTAYASRFGAEPEGLWAAPGRVNLIGEHTDYNDGLCLPIALNRRTVAAASRRADGRARISSLDVDGSVEMALSDIAPGRPDNWAAYGLGVLWAMREAGLVVGGLDVVVASDVPIGAGLSSSAALEGAVASAASDLYGLGLLADDAGRAELAALCRRAENEIAQAPTGGLDQTASLRSSAGHALLLDCRDGGIQPVPFDLAAHDLALVVVDTRAEHALVDGQYAERRSSCEQAARLLGVAALRDVSEDRLEAALAELPDDLLRRRTRHVVTEIGRVRRAAEALRRVNFAELGALFYASHASLRDDFEVSCPELDVVVEAARGAGALGARMTGGGFGGSAIVLAARDRGAAIEDAVRAAYARRGWAEPAVFEAEAGPAAGRISAV